MYNINDTLEICIRKLKIKNNIKSTRFCEFFFFKNTHTNATIVFNMRINGWYYSRTIK